MISHESIPGVELRSTIPSQAREWRNDPAIRRWCRQYTLISQHQHEQWLQRIETDPSIKMFGVWASVQGQDHGMVGVCGLTSIDRQNQSAEFSLYIATPYQHRGYARAALTLLLLHGFSDYNLNRIWGESFDGNPAQQLFAALGMYHEGTLRQAYYREGRFIDSHLWAMTREDFNARHRDRLSNGVKRPGHGGQPGPGGAESVRPQPGAAATAGAGCDYNQSITEWWKRDRAKWPATTHPLRFGSEPR